VKWEPGPASDGEESPPGWTAGGDDPAPGRLPPSDLEPGLVEADCVQSDPADHRPLAPDPVQPSPEAPAEADSQAVGYPQDPPRAHRGRSWLAIAVLLAIGLCGLAAGAAGAVRQILPREFSAAQQSQIQTWEMTRRWRALPAGQIFPPTERYQVPQLALNSAHGLSLTARRLSIAPAGNCGKAVSRAAAAGLAVGRCATVLRATYLDSSGSMVVTVGVAAMPTISAATAASGRLAGVIHNQSLAVHAFPVARSAAASFRQPQRQFSLAMFAGPYVVLATAGFADGRRQVPLATDDYILQEMSSLADGLAVDISRRLDIVPATPACPGAPGC